MTVAAAQGNKELVSRSVSLSMDPQRSTASQDRYGRPKGPGGLPFDPEAEIDFAAIVDSLPNFARAGQLVGGLMGPNNG